MRLESILKQTRKMTLGVLFATAVCPAFSQVVPAATESGIPLSVGGGVSRWDVDWAHSKMEGMTLWIDWRPPYVPAILNGLAIEVEARDVNFNHGDKSATFRQDSGQGGVIYTWRHYRNFHVYGKGLIGFGNIDFGSCVAGCGLGQTPYTHDTRTVYAPGGGIEYRVFRHVWARADYEYQFWPHLTGKTFLNPQGFTVGAMYDFGHRNVY
jgi:opacity protein-like surface antigen